MSPLNERNTVNQDEVNRTNFAGRLHPSQRKLVLNNFGPGLFLVIAGVVVLAIAPASGDGRLWLYMSPVFLMIALGLWVCGRRLLELREGRLLSITGWTHGAGRVLQNKLVFGYPIIVYTSVGMRMTDQYRVKIDSRSYEISKKLYSRIQPERNNTVFFTPRTKRIINVAPTP